MFHLYNYWIILRGVNTRNMFFKFYRIKLIKINCLNAVKFFARRFALKKKTKIVKLNVFLLFDNNYFVFIFIIYTNIGYKERLNMNFHHKLHGLIVSFGANINLFF